MAWHAARRGALRVALWLTLAVALCACSAAAPYLGAGTPVAPTASAEPAATPVASPIVEAVAPTSAAPTVVAGETPTDAPNAGDATPPVEPAAGVDDLGLVYMRGASLLQTGYLGGETREIATLPPYDAWAFDGGRLALALGPTIEVIDLVRGEQASLRVETDAEIEFAEVYWGPQEGTLLHVAWIADASAPTHGRRVELRALSPGDGRVLGQAVLPDVAGVTVLRYVDALGGTVALVPRGDEGAFGEVHVVDLGSGETAAVHSLSGEGELDERLAFAMSPDLGQVVTDGTVDGAPGLWLHDLGGDARSRGWRCPEGTRPVSPVWSPDGAAVAFMLQPDVEGGSQDASVLGVWVLKAASSADTLNVDLVMAEAGASSSLVGWTPEGDHPQGGHIVGYHRGEGDDAYVFAVRPDGGDRRILNLGADAVVLGWMPMVDPGAVRVAVDPWPARFAQAQEDPDALATVAAAFVAAHADEPDEALGAALGERLADAGWQLDLGGPQVRRLDDELYVAQLPPLQICLLEGGSAQCVASGHLVMDARRDGDDLGLIYGVIGASSVQPMFVLLGRDAGGAWTPRWSPQGQRDWIATDGEIRFEGEGVGALRVTGTSFGIVLSEDEAVAECHACLHRNLSAIWRRDGEGYARQSALPAKAPLSSVIWEMTEPTPYAVVHEVLRRARADEDAGDLATAGALASLDALGFLAPGVRLIPEDVQAASGTGQERDVVVVLSGEGGARYRATVQDGALVDVTIDNG